MLITLLKSRMRECTFDVNSKRASETLDNSGGCNGRTVSHSTTTIDDDDDDDDDDRGGGGDDNDDIYDDSDDDDDDDIYDDSDDDDDGNDDNKLVLLDQRILLWLLRPVRFNFRDQSTSL